MELKVDPEEIDVKILGALINYARTKLKKLQTYLLSARLLEISSYSDWTSAKLRNQA